MLHSHTVHPPLGALLIRRTVCGPGDGLGLVGAIEVLSRRAVTRVLKPKLPFCKRASRRPILAGGVLGSALRDSLRNSLRIQREDSWLSVCLLLPLASAAARRAGADVQAMVVPEPLLFQHDRYNDRPELSSDRELAWTAALHPCKEAQEMLRCVARVANCTLDAAGLAARLARSHARNCVVHDARRARDGAERIPFLTTSPAVMSSAQG